MGRQRRGEAHEFFGIDGRGIHGDRLSRSWSQVDGIEIGWFQLRWYSIAYLAGIFIGYWYLLKLLKQPARRWAAAMRRSRVLSALGII